MIGYLETVGDGPELSDAVKWTTICSCGGSFRTSLGWKLWLGVNHWATKKLV